MSIDMQSYAGEILDSAAESQQISPPTFNENTQEDFPVHKEFLEPPVDSVTSTLPQEAPLEPIPTRQELNFRALTKEVELIKAKSESDKREYELNLELLKANIAQQQRPMESQQQRSRKLFDGMQDGDIPNVSEIRQAWEQREAEYQSRIEELSVAQDHPDYAEVLQKYTAPLLKQKPHLADGIQGARNKALFAYELGKMYQGQFQQTQEPTPQPQPPQQNTIAQRIVENSRKPGTLSGSGGTPSLSKAEWISSMSDQEFMKFASKNLNEI